MSKTTLRKRIAITATTALFAGMLTVASAPVASAHNVAGGANIVATLGQVNASLFVATLANTTGAAATAPTKTLAAMHTGSLSLGLLAKDSSSGTAQTATALGGAVLSLYAQTNTAAAFSVTGGSLSGTFGGDASAAATYGSDLKSSIVGTNAIVAFTAGTATGVATLWTLPSTPGTYTVSLLTGFVANSAGVSQIPSYTNGLPSTLSGKILVTVVAASAGAVYSPVYSACNTATATLTATATYPSGVDSSTTVVANDGDWYIDFYLRDAYQVNLASGNVVVTATNGAFVNIGTAAGATPVAGTASTDVEFTNGAGASSTGQTVRISQPTSGAPLTTTVTITYNGTTVCTKTVTIAGHASKLTVANVGTQNLSTPTGAGSAQWMYQQIGLYSAGLFTVLATDSAGNIVTTPTTYGAFSADAATLTTTVQGMVFPTLASSTSSSSPARFALGSFACGANAGEANVKVKFTIAATGTVLSSDAFKARCAGTATTYVASLDKASYVQGELAKLTIAWKDSKGFAANNITAVGANTMSLPYMTGVTTGPLTGANPASNTAVIANADGTSTYTLTVGTTSGLTAGTYTGVVEFTAPALGVTSTPTYKLTTGADTTSNADVLKSIVALIASINKQIQALQKLILARR